MHHIYDPAHIMSSSHVSIIPSHKQKEVKDDGEDIENLILEVWDLGVGWGLEITIYKAKASFSVINLPHHHDLRFW